MLLWKVVAILVSAWGESSPFYMQQILQLVDTGLVCVKDKAARLC